MATTPKEQETVKQLNERMLILSKTVEKLVKATRDSTKSFKGMKDSFEDTSESIEEQEEKLNNLIDKFKVLQDNIVNIDEKYESFASRLVRPLNIGALSGTLGIGAGISMAHSFNQELSGIMDSFRSLSNSSGSAGEAMSTWFSAMGQSSAGRETLKGAMMSLNNAGVELGPTFTKLTAEVGNLDQITGVAADSWAGFHSELVRGMGATIDDVQELSSALIGTGLKGAQLEAVMSTVKTTIEQIGFVSRDGVKSIKSLTQSMGASISVFSKMGVSAQKAGEFIGSMMNPEDFAKNSTLIANLGISYEDYANSLETAEGKTKLLNKAMENMPQLAERISAIRDPFQRMNLAKSLGVPMEIVSKMAGKTKSEIQDMMKMAMQESSEKEALEKKKSMAKASQEKFEDALWLLKMKMLGPVMSFVSNNYGNFFKVLDENAGSVARSFKALFGVIGKLIPLLVKVSIFIGENIAKAFEIVVGPVGKLTDLLLKLTFPILNNLIIPVVRKFAKGIEWLAENLTKVTSILIPFVAILGGFIVLKKGLLFFQSLNDSLKSTFLNAKESAMKLAKGDFKGAKEKLLSGTKTENLVTKTKLDNWKELAKGIYYPIVRKLSELKRNFSGDNSTKPSLRDAINKRKGGVDSSKSITDNLFKKEISSRDKFLKAIEKNKLSKMNPGEKLRYFAEKTKAPIKSFPQVTSKVGGLVGLDAVGMGIGVKGAKLLGTGFVGTLSKFLNPLAKTFGFISKFLGPIVGKLAFWITPLIAGVEGFISAEKYFNKELTSNQEEQLKLFETRISNGEKLNKEESIQLENLRKIKSKMMTQEEKDLLSNLKEKQKTHILSIEESRQLESLLKKEIASTATYGEKLASSLSGFLSFGLLSLIDSTFDTEYSKAFANALLPISNSIVNFIKSFSPLVDTFSNIWNEFLVQLRWAWARISAFVEIEIINPILDIWNSFKAIGSSLMDSFSGLFGNISFGDGVMKKVSDKIKWFWDILKTSFSKGFNLLLTGFKIFIDLIKIVPELISAFYKGYLKFTKGFTDAFDFLKKGDFLGAFKSALGGIGDLLISPLEVFANKAKIIFNRLSQMFGRTFDGLILKIVDSGLGKTIGLSSTKYAEELRDRMGKWDGTDKATGRFDDFANKFFAANTKGEKQDIFNQLTKSKAFEELMGANSALDEEMKLTYKNMLEMMKKQLIETKENRKEAKMNAGGIVNAVKGIEPSKEIKPEIKLRPISLLRLNPNS